MTRARSRGTAPVEEGPRSEVDFSTPPPERPVSYDWTAIAEKLRRKPGEWALIFTQDRQTISTAIRQGSISALRRDKGFESRSANNRHNARPRTCDLWLRYVPEKDTTKEKA